MTDHIPPGYTTAGPVLAPRRRAATLSMVAAVRRCLRQFDVFSGRARRAEYWKFVVAVGLGQLLILVVHGAIFGPRMVFDPVHRHMNLTFDGGLPGTIFSFLMITPVLAVTFRRLHDRDHSGWWAVVPLAIVVLPLLATALWSLAPPGLRPGPSIGEYRFTLGGTLPVLIVIPAAITAVILFIQLARAGTPGPNRFGPDPLEVTP